MSKPFDATLKDLICSYPADWLTQLRIPITGPLEIISADLSTVTAAADTLIKMGNLVIHIDVESGPDDALARRMLLYNVLAHHHTGLPVRSVAVLLRSNAQRANLVNRLDYETLSFQFDIVRMWEVPAEDILQAGVGLLPLAVLGKPPKGKTRAQALRSQVHTIVERAKKEAGPLVPEILTSTLVLAGMHHNPELVYAIFQGAIDMIESSTYGLIEVFAKQKLTRDLIKKQGTAKFGEPSDEQAAKLAAIIDLDRLERLAVRLVKVDSWDALLRGR